jgi:cyclopropane-fatty-acyl-phospholipid synthase
VVSDIQPVDGFGDPDGARPPSGGPPAVAAVGAGIAARLAVLAEAVLGTPLPLPVRAWDGSVAPGPAGARAPAQLVFHGPRALRWLLWSPDEVGVSRAYVSGDVEITGDLYAAIAALTAPVLDRHPRPGPAELLAIAGELRRLGALGGPPAPPPQELRPRGRLHTVRRDALAVAHHYDAGNAFYRLVLGPSMQYSCGYWPDPAWDEDDLERAQEAKLELICRKLALRPGMRLLDVGCGWGGLLLHAARRHGVQAVGVTVSRQQRDAALARVAAAGLAGRVSVRLRDYRQVDDGPYDAIASVGMAEHVGRARLGEYAATVHRLLAPGGRLLHHTINRAGPPPRRGRLQTALRRTFIERYVFPDGEVLPLPDALSALEGAGLELRDVESLREHYPPTLRAWVRNLEANWADAVRLSSLTRARIWRMYMVMATLGFDAGRLGLNQVLAVRRDGGRSGMPRTRRDLLGPH